jgi:hypothetical protein
MAQPLRSNNPGFGPDYYALWKRLEAELLNLRSRTSEALCTADELAKVKVLQGTWGAYGYVYNMMQEMLADARGDKPSDE